MRDFYFRTGFECNMNKIMKSDNVYEILFSLKYLASHLSKKSMAYRRYAYELLRNHPDSAGKIDSQIMLELDNEAQNIYENVTGNGYIKKGTKSLEISWGLK